MPQANIRRYLKHGTLPQLRIFEACARLGNLTRAAEELHMAQPTASVQIKKLTETIGVPLFEQVGKRIFLTDAGRLLHQSCQEVFRTFSNLDDTLSDIRGLKFGRLRLAASITGQYFASRMLGEFTRRHPGIEPSLQVHNRRDLIDRLASNEDDLYLFVHPPEEQEVMAQAILPNPMVAFARADNGLVAEKNIAFARLAEEPFLMREPGSGTRLLVQRLFARHGLAPRIRMELSTNDAINQAILAGMGVSILPRYTLRLDSEDPRLACLDVEGFPLERHWHIVYPAGKRLSAVARAFMDFVRVEARPMMLGYHGQARQ